MPFSHYMPRECLLSGNSSSRRKPKVPVLWPDLVFQEDRGSRPLALSPEEVSLASPEPGGDRHSILGARWRKPSLHS